MSYQGDKVYALLQFTNPRGGTNIAKQPDKNKIPLVFLYETENNLTKFYTNF